MEQPSSFRESSLKTLRAVTTVTSLWVVAVLATGCGAERSTADRSSSAQKTTSRTLACTGPDEPANFPAYSLGPRFEDLPFTNQDRVCDQAPPGAAPGRRLNIIEYSYGSCEPPPDEGGCARPISVQNWPRCERDPSKFPASHLKDTVKVRGVPGHLYEGGLRLEVYAGKTTAVVFGDHKAQVLRAGRALVRAPVKPSAPVTQGDASRPLPKPPPGPISCK